MNQKDERLEKVEQITINWETFKKTLARNYLDPNYEYQRQDRSFVLRLYPSFEAEMEVEYYESRQGRHYDSNWDEKPFHIRPEIILLEGCDGNPLRWAEFPTETNTRHALSDDVVEENDIEELVEEGREIFWSDLKCELPDSINLGRVHGYGNYAVSINWDFEE